jgi:hypothetical protein
VVEHRERQRPEEEVLHPVVRQRTGEPERQLRVCAGPAGNDERDVRRQAPRREGKRLVRRRVEPLHVVDRQQHQASRRKRTHHGDERRGDRPSVGGSFRVADEERSREHAPLRRWQVGPNLLESRADKIRNG